MDSIFHLLDRQVKYLRRYLRFCGKIIYKLQNYYCRRSKKNCGKFYLSTLLPTAKGPLRSIYQIEMVAGVVAL